jgi:hypothetical protein
MTTRSQTAAIIEKIGKKDYDVIIKRWLNRITEAAAFALHNEQKTFRTRHLLQIYPTGAHGCRLGSKSSDPRTIYVHGWPNHRARQDCRAWRTEAR